LHKLQVLIGWKESYINTNNIYYVYLCLITQMFSEQVKDVPFPAILVNEVVAIINQTTINNENTENIISSNNCASNL